MKRALVVDDNDVNRILATRLLTKLGWTVAEANCGEDALTWLRANTAEPASDWRFPNSSSC